MGVRKSDSLLDKLPQNLSKIVDQQNNSTLRERLFRAKAQTHTTGEDAQDALKNLEGYSPEEFQLLLLVVSGNPQPSTKRTSLRRVKNTMIPMIKNHALNQLLHK